MGGTWPCSGASIQPCPQGQQEPPPQEALQEPPWGSPPVPILFLQDKFPPQPDEACEDPHRGEAVCVLSMPLPHQPEHQSPKACAEDTQGR